MDDATTKIELDYAPRMPVLRRRRVRLALVALAVASALGGAVWKTKPLIQRAPYVYSQWRCMRFTAPPDQVAYEEDESRAAALATRADYLSMPWRAPAATQPLMQPVGFVPPPLARLGGSKRAAVFVGSLTPANGRELLVTVTLSVGAITGDGDRHLQLMPFAATPVPLLGRVTRDSFRHAGGESAFFNLARTYRLRLYWGQRDPQHPDRFTIRYVINEIPGVIEGRVDNDGKIKFTVLEGPLANRMHW